MKHSHNSRTQFDPSKDLQRLWNRYSMLAVRGSDLISENFYRGVYAFNIQPTKHHVEVGNS